LNQQASQTDIPQAWTVMRLLRRTSAYLTEKGVDKARLDAEVLLAHSLGLTRVELYLNFDRPLTSPELDLFRELVRRRAAFEPVAYIIGVKEFYSLELEVDPRVLIPRPETELVVDEAVRLAREQWPDPAIGSLTLLDLGTGSGAIALALARELPLAEVWATDISGPALEVARANAQRHGFSSRIQFFQGDLFGAVGETRERFNLVISNLPYIPRFVFAEMDPDVREYEPMEALDGGEDGLDLIGRAVIEARAYLRPHGALILEIWPTQTDRIRELGQTQGYDRVRILKDHSGYDLIAVLVTE